jgi:hypothetical protein
MTTWVPKPKAKYEESDGNDGSVESEESQKQASGPFHEPLGNPAKSRRDSHIPTAPATRLMEKWKTKNRFPTFPQPRMLSHLEGKQKEASAAFAPAEGSTKSSCR